MLVCVSDIGIYVHYVSSYLWHKIESCCRNKTPTQIWQTAHSHYRITNNTIFTVYGNVPKRVYHHKQWTGAAPDRLWGWMTLCHWNPAQPFACAFWNILWWHSVWLQMLPLTSVTTPIYICIKVRITAGVTHWSIQSDELSAARTPPLLSQRYLRVTSSQITPSH